MSTDVSPPLVKQLRLVVEADDFDEAVAFYRDVLGMTEEFFVESEGDARVMALQAGRATLEIVNPAQRRLIDQLEVGREVSRSIRDAFEARYRHVYGRPLDGIPVRVLNLRVSAIGYRPKSLSWCPTDSGTLRRWTRCSHSFARRKRT